MTSREDIARRRIEDALANRATNLDLSRLRLAKVPDEVRELDNLTVLQLSENNLQELPRWLAEHRQLTALGLRGSGVARLPDWLGELGHLSELDLSWNNLTSPPEWLRNLTQLKALNLAANNLTSLPEWLCHLTQLTELNLGGTQFPLPQWLAGLAQLESLDLNFSQLTALPDWIRRLPKLKVLLLNYNKLKSLPRWFGDLTQLKGLNLSANVFTQTPECIRDLAGLESLYLTANQLAILPEWVGNFTTMRSLFVGGNPIAALPESLSQLTELQALYLGGELLTSFPRWLGEHTSIEVLYLGDTPQIPLPSWLGYLSQLKALFLFDMHLEEVPEWLSTFTQLEHLSLYGNKLTTLPDWLGDLTNLQQLNLYRNQLTILPSTIGSLTRLRELKLHENRLTALPDGLRALTQLTDIDVHDNQLTALPDWLLDLPELIELRVDGNPLSNPPPEITMSGATPVLDFLAARREGSTKQWVSKMLVVGEGGVGKTSTIKSLLDRPFDRREDSTHGLGIYSFNVHHPLQPNTTMRLTTWDFGGQQIYHATHQFFLTDRSLFLLLWNSRLGWEQGRLRYWLDIISARAPLSPILVVATHATQSGRPVDIPLDDLRREYPQIASGIALDNETRNGLDELRTSIAACAANLPLMGTQWPTKWLTAADRVRAIPATHIPPSVMWSAMAAAGLHDTTHQRYVATALHQLGDVLYYQNDPQLAETVILRPEWVNEYISMVLDSPEVERSHGLLTRDHVNTIWADLDKGMRDHFLDMMEKYDLSYRLDGGSPTDLCLVVERLPWNAPPYQHLWDRHPPSPTTREIKVVYQLNTTPPGIPTWFIARSHRFSTGMHWRTGALLAHPDGTHRALIRCDTHRNIIDLTVRGPSPAAFFAVLNDGLAVTLSRYPGLNITRYVPCPCRGTEQEACSERFDYEHLQSRLNRTPPRYDIECRASGTDIYVPLLLLGLAPSEHESLRDSFERLTKTVIEQRHDLEEHLAERLDDMNADMQRQFLKVQQHIKNGLETSCPSVFVLVPTKRGRITGASYELRLYCEEPGTWHPLPGGTGTYKINDSPAWLQRLGPYLRVLLDILKHAAPLAAPLLGMTVAALGDRVAADLAAMTTLIDEIPDVPSIGTSLPEAAAVEHPSTEADFRALESLLARLDPDRSWGGLSRIATPEGLTLYLCPTHAAPYQRTASPLNQR